MSSQVNYGVTPLLQLYSAFLQKVFYRLVAQKDAHSNKIIHHTACVQLVGIKHKKQKSMVWAQTKKDNIINSIAEVIREAK